MDSQWLQFFALGAGVINFVISAKVNVEVMRLRAEMYEKFVTRK